jgi:hypothetical protein
MTGQTNNKVQQPIDFEQIKERLHESDFDGHTAFQSMTYTQKLTWLSELVVSIYKLAKENPDAGCNAFFNFGQEEKKRRNEETKKIPNKRP